MVVGPEFELADTLPERLTMEIEAAFVERWPDPVVNLVTHSFRLSALAVAAAAEYLTSEQFAQILRRRIDQQRVDHVDPAEAAIAALRQMLN